MGWLGTWWVPVWGFWERGGGWRGDEGGVVSFFFLSFFWLSFGALSGDFHDFLWKFARWEGGGEGGKVARWVEHGVYIHIHSCSSVISLID